MLIDQRDEAANRLAAGTDALAGVEQLGDKRAFQNGVLGIERDQSVEILCGEAIVPGVVDTLTRSSNRLSVTGWRSEIIALSCITHPRRLQP